MPHKTATELRQLLNYDDETAGGDDDDRIYRRA